MPTRQGWPSREEAERLLREAEPLNPGPWVDHSRTTARCAQAIAEACGMDGEKAYALGLLHDIGRRYGRDPLTHVWKGYQYLTGLGYPEAARICLTHSYNTRDARCDVAQVDFSSPMFCRIGEALASCEYDDYDRLIQLCDSIAAAHGVIKIEERMEDILRRYGSYPREKWDKNLELMDYFARKAGRDIYEITCGGRTVSL